MLLDLPGALTVARRPRWGATRRLTLVGWVASAWACGGQGRAEDSGGQRGVTSPAACTRTRDCRGGEFCDRGSCSKIATQDQWGHGYGAQCVGEEFYPPDTSGSGRAVHCRSYECVDGHCSSCLSDTECEEGYVCAAAPAYPEYPDRAPDYPGRRCTLRAIVEDPPLPCDLPSSPVPCGSTKVELPEPALASNDAAECHEAEDCRGDEFCDRGRCASITVDPFGHGYGAMYVRREPPSVEDTCLGFLSIGRWCSSCLVDSECYPEAPYCIHHPLHPEARSCAPHPEAEYYDAAGSVAPTFSEANAWLEEYRAFLEYDERYQQARAEVGLPVAPAPPPIAGEPQ